MITPLYYYEPRVLLYRVLYVGLARSRSSSVFQYTVLFTGVPYVAYRYSCEAVWCTVRTQFPPLVHGECTKLARVTTRTSTNLVINVFLTPTLRSSQADRCSMIADESCMIETSCMHQACTMTASKPCIGTHALYRRVMHSRGQYSTGRRAQQHTLPCHPLAMNIY
eukprot:COSAG05_NODE_991_length_6277_cov_77.221305_5_plen_166_part_00